MPAVDRPLLHFAEAAEKNFRFLLACGFDLVQSGPTFVRFESRRAYVNIYHGRKSFELGLEIGPTAARREVTAYSMSEIVRFVEPSKADEYRNYATRDADGVKKGVRLLASLFRRYVENGLLDEEDVFVRLEKQRSRWKNDFARHVNLVQARKQLDAAWSIRDYPKVVKLLEPLQSDLVPSELKKLEYAKKEVARR